jgi:hypothetical protein
MEVERRKDRDAGQPFQREIVGQVSLHMVDHAVNAPLVLAAIGRR